MDRLTECPVLGPDRRRSRGPYDGWVDEDKGGQRLTITSDDTPFRVYALDPRDGGVAWPEAERRPDAVLVAGCHDGALVCFLELKASLKTDPEKHAHAVTQIEGGVAHFAPAVLSHNAPSHGAMHHARWQSGEDLPDPAPDGAHRVTGIVVAFRQLPRMPPEPPRTVCGKDIVISVVQISLAKHNQALVTLEDLLRKARV